MNGLPSQIGQLRAKGGPEDIESKIDWVTLPAQKWEDESIFPESFLSRQREQIFHNFQRRTWLAQFRENIY
jgi:hypothetical protein